MATTTEKTTQTSNGVFAYVTFANQRSAYELSIFPTKATVHILGSVLVPETQFLNSTWGKNAELYCKFKSSPLLFLL